jgi:hypothetical protein
VHLLISFLFILAIYNDEETLWSHPVLIIVFSTIFGLVFIMTLAGILKGLILGLRTRASNAQGLSRVFLLVLWFIVSLLYTLTVFLFTLVLLFISFLGYKDAYEPIKDLKDVWDLKKLNPTRKQRLIVKYPFL